MAVFIFISSYTPDQEVSLILFNVKLQYLAIAFVLLDIIQIPYGNAGGHLAHLGGAALGFFYARKLQQGSDIGEPFGRFIDRLVDWFQSKPKMKTVYKSKTSTSPKSFHSEVDVNQKKIDKILDKISASGYESLSKEEKEFLFKAGKK
jgi:hypothetical protein